MANSHHSAAILSIGDELALGQKLDTNAQWLADQLVSRGITVAEHITISDDLGQHIEALRRLAAAYPLVISTGGLGPTLDDLTRQALASLMGEELVEDPAAHEHLLAIFAKRGRELTDLQRTQALRPRSALCLDNPTGTAPGLWGSLKGDAASEAEALRSAVGRGGRPMATADSLEDSVAGRGTQHSSTDLFCLPGPPGEMKPMFERSVVPLLRPARRITTRVLHCLGIGEGDLAQRLGPLMDRSRNPLVGTTASGGVVSIRVRYEEMFSPDEEAASDESSRKTRMLSDLEETERLARAAAGPFIFGESNDTIESVLLELLGARNDRLVTAESCTAGGLGELFTNTPGASDVYVGGFVTYSNEMKTTMLGVPADLIAQHGAVSEPVARAMAEGALRNVLASTSPARQHGALHALAITGIAGPDGGSDEKPVGTVFIARASTNPDRQGGDGTDIEVRRFLITGSRHDIRDRAAKLALMMLRFHLLNLKIPRTLWQIQLDGSPFPNR